MDEPFSNRTGKQNGYCEIKLLYCVGITKKIAQECRSGGYLEESIIRNTVSHNPCLYVYYKSIMNLSGKEPGTSFT